MVENTRMKEFYETIKSHEQNFVNTSERMSKIENRLNELHQTMASINQNMEYLLRKSNETGSGSNGRNVDRAGGSEKGRARQEAYTPPHIRNPGHYLNYNLTAYKVKFPEFNGENPQEWIKEANRFFQLNANEKTKKVLHAGYYMVGVADTWYMEYVEGRADIDWGTFCEMLLQRFLALGVEDSHVESVPVMDDLGECSYSYEMITEKVLDEMSERDKWILILKSKGMLDGVLNGFALDTGVTIEHYCSEACKVCEHLDHTEKLIICDNCEGTFHVSCSRPRVTRIPVGKWLCSSCLKKKHKILNEKFISKVDIVGGSEGELGSLEFMFRDTEPYETSVLIGDRFQANVPEWSGPVNHYHRGSDLIGDIQELETEVMKQLKYVEMWRPKLAAANRRKLCRAKSNSSAKELKTTNEHEGEGKTYGLKGEMKAAKNGESETKPEAYGETERISLVSSFRASILTGKNACIDHTDEAEMKLMDIKERDWSKLVLEATAPSLEEKLGKLAPAQAVAGVVAPYCVESLAGLTLNSPGDLAISLVFGINTEHNPCLEGHVFPNPVDTKSFMVMLCYKNGSLTREDVRNRCAEKSWDVFDTLFQQTKPLNEGKLGFSPVKVLPSKTAILSVNPTFLPRSEDDQRLLAYEFGPKGSMENHLFRRSSYFQPLAWSLRMKIVLGAAMGLAFLHNAETKVSYRNSKTSNILLDSNYNAKLSDFGLAKDGPIGDQSHVSTRVMVTYGYAAPEFTFLSTHIWDPGGELSCAKSIEDADDAEWEEDSEEDQGRISVHALAGNKVHNTIQILGNVGKKRLNILIYSGSTNSLLDARTTKEMNCMVEETKMCNITVADGSKTSCHTMCSQFSWQMQGYRFAADLKIIQLGSCDMILGAGWMSKHNPVTFDFQRNIITLVKDGRRVNLKGIELDKEMKILSAKALQKFIDKATYGVMVQVLTINVEREQRELDPQITKVLDEFQSVFEEPIVGGR